MSSHVFISYAREDRAIALRLRESLRTLGAGVWLDVIDLIPGQDWQVAISDALRKSTHVVMLISAASVNKTGFVQKEVRAALDRLAEFPPDAVFLIPVRLDGSQPKHDALSRLQWVDLFPDYDRAVEQIAKSLWITSGERVPATPAELNASVTRSPHTQSGLDSPRLVIEGYFTPDPTDPTAQGVFLRNVGAPAHDIRIQMIGTKACGLTFDDVPVLLATDPPRQLVMRFTGYARSIWDVLSFIEIQNLKPVSLAELFPRRTAQEQRSERSRRIILHIEYRDTRDNELSDSQYYFDFIESDKGIPVKSRLVVRRAPNAAQQ